MGESGDHDIHWADYNAADMRLSTEDRGFFLILISSNVSTAITTCRDQQLGLMQLGTIASTFTAQLSSAQSSLDAAHSN